MKIKEKTLNTVLSLPLSKIKDFNNGEEVLICEIAMR